MAIDAVHNTRVGRVRELLTTHNLDYLIVTPSADMAYLINYFGHVSERPTFLIISKMSQTTLILPVLEALNLHTSLQDISVRICPYQETDDPYTLVHDIFGSCTGETLRIAVSDQIWGSFLLRLQSTLPTATFVEASPLLRHLRMVKSEDELSLLREAAHRADRAFDHLIETRFTGRTELEVAAVLNEALHEAGLRAANWGPIVASGPHSASPHHIISERTIHEGDVVVLDFGGVFEGYQADITRTVAVGTPSDELRQVYEVVRRAQQAAVKAVRPGASAASIDRAARAVIEEAGLGEAFIHRTGHGIGLEVHEEPYIVAGNQLQLEPGMTFSIEPGIYIAGKFGVRIEDIVAVTAEGVERLNQATSELVVMH
jgi:Xaa-Pro aminopeptidase